MSKIYISGPITGMPDLNRKAFSAMAAKIRDAGHIPVNPHEVCAHLSETATWADYMRLDIKAMMDCDAVAFLPGWWESRGACVEERLAIDLGIKRYMPGEGIK